MKKEGGKKRGKGLTTPTGMNQHRKTTVTRVGRGESAPTELTNEIRENGGDIRKARQKRKNSKRDVRKQRRRVAGKPRNKKRGKV